MKFRVYGNVKDPETNQPLTDVTVKLYLDQEELQQSKSVENGFYESIADIDDSRIESGQQLRVTFENEGYQIQEQRVLATEGAFNLDVKLEKEVIPPPPPFNWKPVIIGGGAFVVLLIVGVIAWRFIAGPKPPVPPDDEPQVVTPKPDKDTPTKPTTPKIYSQGRLTVRGTWSCDLDVGRESKEGADFWWEQVTKTERYIVPKNGAKFSVIGIRSFDSISHSDLLRLNYSTAKINGSNATYNGIPQGSVVAAITNEGRYSKFIIEKYGYNLSIRWVTYEKAKRQFKLKSFPIEKKMKVIK